MAMRKVRVCLLVVVNACLMAGSAHAAPITILNPGFEEDILADGDFNFWPPGDPPGQPITGWTLLDEFGGGGLFNPTAAEFPGEAPEGFNTAFTNGSRISQTLGDVLTANTTYTLQVEVGNRLDVDFRAYTVRLFVDDFLLAGEKDLSPDPGTFETSTVVFTALPGHPKIGGALRIQFDLVAGGAQINFDDVRLEADIIPEPGTFATMLGAGLAGLLGYGRRRPRTDHRHTLGLNIWRKRCQEPNFITWPADSNPKRNAGDI